MAHQHFAPIPGAQPERVWPEELADRWICPKSEVKEYGQNTIRSELGLTQAGWERFSRDVEKIVHAHYERWPVKLHHSIRKAWFEEDAAEVIKHWQTSFNIPTPPDREISPLLQRMFWDWCKHKQRRRYGYKSANAKAGAEAKAKAKAKAKEADGEMADLPSPTHRLSMSIRPSPAPSTIPVSPMKSLSDECESEPVSLHIPHSQLVDHRQASFQLLIRDSDGNQTLLNLADIQHHPLRAPATILCIDADKLVEEVIESDVNFDPAVHTFELAVHQRVAGMQATNDMDLRKLVQAAYNEEPTQPCVLAVVAAKKNAPWSRKRSASSPYPSMPKRRRVGETTPLRTRSAITPSPADKASTLSTHSALPPPLTPLHEPSGPPIAETAADQVLITGLKGTSHANEPIIDMVTSADDANETADKETTKRDTVTTVASAENVADKGTAIGRYPVNAEDTGSIDKGITAGNQDTITIAKDEGWTNETVAAEAANIVRNGRSHLDKPVMSLKSSIHIDLSNDDDDDDDNDEPNKLDLS